MDFINLAGTGRRTSRLGFGCSNLMGATGRKQSLALLHTAYDAGVRHFDVAPMYGFGEAECCLGEFIAQGHKDITVTTKYGFAPARNRRLLNLARHTVRPLLMLVPPVKQKLAKAANTLAGTGSRVPFSAEEARHSLENSLKALRTDRIDVFLLHEATANDIQDSELLHFLERAKEEGTIGSYGVGSEARYVAALLEQRSAYCEVIQHEWIAKQNVVPTMETFRIYHRILSSKISSLHASLLSEPGLIAAWGREIGLDIRSRSLFASLLLTAALNVSTDSILLFSSKCPEHINENVRVAGEKELIAPASNLFRKLESQKVWG